MSNLQECMVRLYGCKRMLPKIKKVGNMEYEIDPFELLFFDEFGKKFHIMICVLFVAHLLTTSDGYPVASWARYELDKNKQYVYIGQVCDFCHNESEDEE